MIKKILVALDPDSDTAVATRYATDIAKRYGSSVTGLAVVDLGQIEAGTKGGGIGSFYYAEKLREQLTTETRAKARELLEKYESSMEDSGVDHIEVVEEGVPFQRIVEDMKFHDLLVIGKDPHFFYGHPEKSTDTLAKVVKNTVGPTLVVGDSYSSISNILVAFDGSNAASRALKQFVQYMPFGNEIQVEIVSVYAKESTESDLILRLAAEFVEAHGLKAKTTALKGDNTSDLLIQYVSDSAASLLVAGAHSVSGIRRIAFGSTTNRLINDVPIPLFVDS